jgi:hypothetical protein
MRGRASGEFLNEYVEQRPSTGVESARLERRRTKAPGFEVGSNNRKPSKGSSMSVKIWVRSALTVLVVSSSLGIVGCGDSSTPSAPATTPPKDTAPPKDVTPPK